MLTQVIDAALLARTLKLLYRSTNRRCNVYYLGWMLGLEPVADRDRVMLAIRDELTSLNLIGWSYPPQGTPEIFLSDNGKTFIEEHLQARKENVT